MNASDITIFDRVIANSVCISFMLLLSNEYRIYFVNYSIAIVVTVTMNAANVNSIADVSFSELVIVCMCFSYIYIIEDMS